MEKLFRTILEFRIFVILLGMMFIIISVILYSNMKTQFKPFVVNEKLENFQLKVIDEKNKPYVEDVSEEIYVNFNKGDAILIKRYVDYSVVKAKVLTTLYFSLFCIGIAVVGVSILVTTEN